jgi:hypothetical protein
MARSWQFAVDVRLRCKTICAVALASFALGVALTSNGSQGVACAQSRPLPAMTVQLPPEGLVFIGPNGRAVARLVGEANGGQLELFDAQEHVAVRLSATPGGGSLDLRSHMALDIVRTIPDPSPGY